jgi:hypothetical protein
MYTDKNYVFNAARRTVKVELTNYVFNDARRTV